MEEETREDKWKERRTEKKTGNSKKEKKNGRRLRGIMGGIMWKGRGKRVEAITSLSCTVYLAFPITPPLMILSSNTPPTHCLYHSLQHFFHIAPFISTITRTHQMLHQLIRRAANNTLKLHLVRHLPITQHLKLSLSNLRALQESTVQSTVQEEKFTRGVKTVTPTPKIHLLTT